MSVDGRNTTKKQNPARRSRRRFVARSALATAAASVAMACCPVSLALAALMIPLVGAAAETRNVDAEGTIHVPSFLLPESSYLSPETRAVLKLNRDSGGEWAAYTACGQPTQIKPSDAAEFRKCQMQAFSKTRWNRNLRARYPDVRMTPQVLGGVYTEVFAPNVGVAPSNRERVLINVHGGAFLEGSRTFSHLESVPIASMGKLKVISIDYRLGPEYTFPAANEDVAAVYRELLKIYKPTNIGMYGCSAGAVLIAQSMAWFQRHELPLPGAIGLFCHGAPKFAAEERESLESERNKWVRSDSGHIGTAISGSDHQSNMAQFPYYRGVRVDNPLASPGDYDEVMSKFPPTLFVSGTRDFTLSATLATHAQLTRLGVKADLHVWEGMAHAFIYDVELPESREAYQVIVRFFSQHLGR